MSRDIKQADTQVDVGGKRRAPVSVKLKRVDCDHAKLYPPEGMKAEWWQRLKDALGTCSSDFVLASLHQLIAAARLPGTGICEVAVNAALSLIEGARPRDEVEGALVIQMACTHSAAMAVLAKFADGCGGVRSLTAHSNAAARLLKAYTAQVETLRRLRNGGSQLVRVEHVHVNAGGQAVVGTLEVREESARKGASVLADRRTAA